MDWTKQALIQTLIGFDLCLFGTLTSGIGHNVQPIIIIGFVFFVPCPILNALLVDGDLKGKKDGIITTIVLLFVAGRSTKRSV